MGPDQQVRWLGVFVIEPRSASVTTTSVGGCAEMVPEMLAGPGDDHWSCGASCLLLLSLLIRWLRVHTWGSLVVGLEAWRPTLRTRSGGTGVHEVVRQQALSLGHHSSSRTNPSPASCRQKSMISVSTESGAPSSMRRSHNVSAGGTGGLPG